MESLQYKPTRFTALGCQALPNLAYKQVATGQTVVTLLVMKVMAVANVSNCSRQTEERWEVERRKVLVISGTVAREMDARKFWKRRGSARLQKKQKDILCDPLACMAS